MANYKNYQNKGLKYKNSQDITQKRMSLLTKNKMNQDQIKQWVLWNTFYIRNFHRFITHFLGVKLHLFQIIWIYLMSINNIFVTIASRSVSKSFLIANYIVGQCILRPGLKIIITADTLEQSNNIIEEKIRDELYNVYPNIKREIKKIHTSGDKFYVIFFNGSRIRVKVSNDKARSARSHINIYEESRMIDKKIIDTVFTPFLVSRTPPFRMLEEYKGDEYKEPSQEIFITSCWYKESWTYDLLRTIIKMTYNGKKTMFLAFDYKMVLEAGIKTLEQLEQDKEKMSSIAWTLEYENLFWGEHEGAYFKYNLLNNNRNCLRAWYPIKSNETKNEYDIKRLDDEIRIISCDIAVESGKDSDNTIITCIRLLPRKDGYKREIVYVKAFNGTNSNVQALEIKRVFYQFCSVVGYNTNDYIIIDYKGVGKGVYDPLTSITYDSEYDKEYEGFTIINENNTLIKSNISSQIVESMKSRTLSKNAIPAVYPIVGTSDLNSDIAEKFKDDLNKNKISLLVDEIKANEIMRKKIQKRGKKAQELLDDPYFEAWFLQPYIETSMCISEIVNLEYKIVSNNIKLDPNNKRDRKDRYSSISYGNYFAGLLDQKLLKDVKKSSNWLDYVTIGNGSFESKFY